MQGLGFFIVWNHIVGDIGAKIRISGGKSPISFG